MSAEPTTKQRAARCGRVLSRYGTDDDPEMCLVDFLADARHWCDRNAESFWELDRKAHQHYLAEIHEERIKS
jgi:hypothetical protein